MAIVWLQNITGSDKFLEFPFNFLSDVTVTHNLGRKKPSVTVIDSAWTECKWTITYWVGTVSVHFSAPFTWTIYLN